jgi:pyruvate/2-oxoacid:ferredoxin oxidoreductase beta subunit
LNAAAQNQSNHKTADEKTAQGFSSLILLLPCKTMNANYVYSVFATERNPIREFIHAIKNIKSRFAETSP